MKWWIKGNNHNRVVNAKEPWDAVYTLPEFDGMRNTFQATKQEDGSWEIKHWDTNKTYIVKATDGIKPPKEEEDEWEDWANQYIRMTDNT